MIELSQKSILKGTRRVALSDDNVASIQVCEGVRKSEFSVPLGVLNPSPARFTRTGLKFLPAVVFLPDRGRRNPPLLLSREDGRSDKPHRRGGLLRLHRCIFGFLLIVSSVKLWNERCDLILFHNRFSGAAVFSLFYGLPDRASYEQFSKELTKRITEANGEADTPMAASIPAQLQAFSKLLDQKILTPEEFERIKNSLLESMTGGKQIGFR
jgi:hypothetical protein